VFIYIEELKVVYSLRIILGSISLVYSVIQKVLTRQSLLSSKYPRVRLSFIVVSVLSKR
jgi:hypothetical protein